MKFSLKFLISFILSVFIFSVLVLPCFGASYSAYSSVTASTSQINILIQSMFNQPDFNPFQDWVALRTGDQDYSLFYNIKSDGSAQRLRYYGSSSGYNTVWHFSRSFESNFSFFSNDYTYVGNVSDSLGSDSFQSFLRSFLFKWTVPFILILFIFFIFRIKKRSREVAL